MPGLGSAAASGSRRRPAGSAEASETEAPVRSTDERPVIAVEAVSERSRTRASELREDEPCSGRVDESDAEQGAMNRGSAAGQRRADDERLRSAERVQTSRERRRRLPCDELGRTCAEDDVREPTATERGSRAACAARSKRPDVRTSSEDAPTAALQRSARHAMRGEDASTSAACERAGSAMQRRCARTA